MGDSTSTASAGTEGFLRAEGVSLVYTNGVRALDGIGLAVESGAFVSLLGPSGCGKSTLLRLVAGLLDPTEGSIRVGVRDSRTARRESSNVAFVFQQPTLLPWRSVRANVALPLELRGEWHSAGRQRVEELLELVGLADFAAAYPHELSGGMQMRASLARALATEPELLLLDEPFAALDDITRQRLNEELLALWARRRFTALFVTHNVAEAVFLSQTIHVMSARPGRFVARHQVPFAYPRGRELRAEGEFAALAGAIGESLVEAHQ